MGFFSSLFRRSKRLSADEWALSQLAQVGDDLSEPHQLEFQVRFPSRTAAEQAVSQLKASGYETKAPEENQGTWGVVAMKQIVPDPDTLKAAHAELDALARSAGGSYEG